MFDTHCHLNFKMLLPNIDDIIQRAKDAGVTRIVVPGTNVKTSRNAVEIAEQHEYVYATVGIHPHHVFQVQNSDIKTQNYNSNLKSEIQKIEALVKNPKVVAVGEIGLDRHYYQNTRHVNYQVTEEFIELQKEFLREQIELAKKYEKSLILHNREAKADTLSVLSKKWDPKLAGRSVFHCCEPDEELLIFAKEHNMYIGVDGDITYRKDKQEFIKKIPLNMLVLETDAPFLHPEPLRSQPRNIRGPNEPKNLKRIAEFIAKTTNIPLDQLIEATTTNAKSLFAII